MAFNERQVRAAEKDVLTRQLLERAASRENIRDSSAARQQVLARLHAQYLEHELTQAEYKAALKEFDLQVRDSLLDYKKQTINSELATFDNEARAMVDTSTDRGQLGVLLRPFALYNRQQDLDELAA